MSVNRLITGNKVIADLLENDQELLKPIDIENTNPVTFSRTAVEIAREMARANGLLEKIDKATIKSNPKPRKERRLFF